MNSPALTSLTLTRMKKILCYLFFHKVRVVHECSAQVQKLICLRCGKYFGINHSVKSFLPWDAELEDLCNKTHPTLFTQYLIKDNK